MSSRTDKLRVVDLFAGCGGLSMGFANAGFNVVAGFDNWDPAIEIYKENFKHPIIKKDLGDTSNVSDIKSFKPDIIIGGPPCQDFSSAGHRDENLGRAQLTNSFAEIMPKYFLMENVPRIQKSGVFPKVLAEFKRLGYGLTSAVLDASKCGAPQARKRFVLIGEIGGEDDFILKQLVEGMASNR